MEGQTKRETGEGDIDLYIPVDRALLSPQTATTGISPPCKATQGATTFISNESYIISVCEREPGRETERGRQ